MDAQNPHSIATLIAKLRDDGLLLVRQEVALAKRELSEKVSDISQKSTTLGVGSIIAIYGGIFFLTSLCILLFTLLQGWGLEMYTAAWVAPLIFAVLLLAIGSSLALSALKAIKQQSLKPEKTLRSLEENKAWLQNKAS